jgi:hypothetical protein
VSKLTTFDLNMIVEPQVRKFCGPLFFASSTTTPRGNIESSGSFGLVSIGQTKLLVTCWHVLDAFKKMHSLDPALHFGIGFGGPRPVAVSFDDLLEMKVDDERRCDLATFDVSDALDLVAASNLDFFNLNANRPPRVRVGDVLYLIGFPGKGRIDNETSIGFPRQPIGVQASQVGEFTFFSRVGNLRLDETDYGGISGAPCFVVEEGAPIKLVGFATGFAPNEMNMLQFTYAKYIGEDGIIRYMTNAN